MGSAIENFRLVRHNAYPNNLLMQLGVDISSITQDQIDGLNYVISTLPVHDRRILSMRFTEQQTLQEIGNSEGCTRERARQFVNRAIQTLQDPTNMKYITHGKHKCEFDEAIYAAKMQMFSGLPIEALALPPRATHALVDIGKTTVGDVLELYSSKELSTVPRIGRDTAAKVEEILKRHLSKMDADIDTPCAKAQQPSNNSRPCTFYLLYSGNKLMFVGYTYAQLRTRLYNLFFMETTRKHPIDVSKVTRIDYVTLPSKKKARELRDYYMAEFRPEWNRASKEYAQALKCKEPSPELPLYTSLPMPAFFAATSVTK